MRYWQIVQAQILQVPNQVQSKTYYKKAELTDKRIITPKCYNSLAHPKKLYIKNTADHKIPSQEHF